MLLGYNQRSTATDTRHSQANRGQTACKPGSVPAPPVARRPGDSHSSGTSVTGRLARPTRAAAWKPACRPPARTPAGAARRPYLVLLPVGFTVPSPLPGTRCALTAPFHPYRQVSANRSLAGGLLSVALSLGSPPPGVTRHRVSVEPGLSSPRPRTGERRPSGRLASLQVMPPSRTVKHRLHG